MKENEIIKTRSCLFDQMPKSTSLLEDFANEKRKKKQTIMDDC